MICEHCKQRHANVTVTQIQSGQQMERHYCDVCAAQFHPYQFEIKEEPASLQQLMTNWFNFVPILKKENVAESSSKTKACPTCGTTYRQFLKQVKFGCGDCYAAFSEQLPQLLEKIQAGTKHVGFVEETHLKEKLNKQISELRTLQQQAIAEERFEDAAKLRDDIRALESKVERGEEQA